MRTALSGTSLLLLGVALGMPVAGVHEAQAMDGLTIMKRDLCHSFKLDCRKQRSTQAKRPVAKPKPPQQAAKTPKPAPAVPTPSVKPSPPAVAAAAPVPREKPAAAASEAPKEKPVAKPVAEAPAVPIPREKPAEPAPDKLPDKTPDAVVAEAPPAAAEAPVPAAPVPRERPSLLPSLPPVASTVVAAPERSETVPAPEARQPEPRVASIAPGATTATGPSTCAQGLRAAKVEFDVVPASFGAGTCPVADPVRLHAVETPSGTVTFPEGPVFNCRFARQFTQWVSDTGSAVVLAQTSKRLEKLATGPGYDCRHRNGDSSGKMSEHAAGDAVDITSMTLDGGTTIRMADAVNPASPSFPVLRALRTTACGYFTTVLGPGANAAHKEHYHFDMGVHGKSGNYRICE